MGWACWTCHPPAPRVLNKHHGTPPAGAVFIGRPCKWGNPFVIGRDGTRPETVAKHRAWLCDQPELMAALPELRGRDLVCFCAPAACHGDTLLALANDDTTMTQAIPRRPGYWHEHNGGYRHAAT